MSATVNADFLMQKPHTRANFSRLNRSMSASSHTTALPTLSLGLARSSQPPGSRLPRAGHPPLDPVASSTSLKKARRRALPSRATATCARGLASRDVLTTPSTFVWSVAVDKNGVAFLGTGSPATVLRVGSTDGKPFTLFETKDLSVQVVRFGPDGSLYAATMPSGKVYRLKPDATPSRTKPAPPWSLTPPRPDAAAAKDRPAKRPATSGT